MSGNAIDCVCQFVHCLDDLLATEPLLISIPAKIVQHVTKEVSKFMKDTI